MIRLFAIALVVFVSASLAHAQAELKYSFEKGDRLVKLYDTPDQQVIFYSGEIMPLNKATSVETVVKKLVPGKDVLLMINSSGGGEARVYNNFGRGLRKACPRESCKITTYVHNACGSACVWLYMYGDERISSSHAMFMFHRKFVGAIGIQIVVQSKDQLKKEFVDLGADPAWLDANIRKLTSNQKGGVIATPDQMIRGGFVQRVDDVFFARTPVWDIPSMFNQRYGPGDGSKYLVEAGPQANAVALAPVIDER